MLYRWDAKFTEHGAVPNKEMHWAMQEKVCVFVCTPNMALNQPTVP